MSSNFVTRTVQSAYPFAIFLAVFASASIGHVKAGASDVHPLLPDFEKPRLTRAPATGEPLACSKSEESLDATSAGACSDPDHEYLN